MKYMAGLLVCKVVVKYFPICMRKVGGGNVVYVHFKDDQDEMGVTHEKPVLLKHVMKM